MKNGLSPRQQGDLGEASALDWFIGQGATVYVPFNSSPDVDLVVDLGDGLVRVQVKTTSYARHGRWCVALCTRGGNQSWSGLVKRFSPERCDRLFVLAADGRRWYVPADQVEGGNGIILGGPKYAAYEIDPGRPFAAARAA